MNNDKQYVFFTGIHNKVFTVNKVEKCQICSRQMPENAKVFMVYQKDSIITGFWKMTCSIECANMVILQNL